MLDSWMTPIAEISRHILFDGYIQYGYIANYSAGSCVAVVRKGGATAFVSKMP